MRDDLPIGCPLHAPRRPCETLDRAALSEPRGRAGAPDVPRRRPVTTLVIPPRITRGRSRQAILELSAAAAHTHDRARALLGAAPRADRSPEYLRRGGCTPDPARTVS